MNRMNLFYGIFQVVIGILGISSYIILLIGKEPVLKWTFALFLCILFLIFGIFRIMEYIKKR